ncbi:MAG TPA: hypothetical protein VMZ66_11445 [Aeromicrobium sp.]|nr:hypothetical protein [Aeromicrobium sp.]
MTSTPQVLGLGVGMNLGWIIGLGSASNETAQLGLMGRDDTALINPGITIEVDDLTPFLRELSTAALKVVHALIVESWRALGA